MIPQARLVAWISGAVLLMSAVLTLQASAQPSYSILDLGALYVSDINDRGEVVGSRTEFRDSRAVLWDNGRTTTLPMDNLNSFWATGINNSGAIVGVGSMRAGAGFTFAVLWPDVSSFLFLGTEAPSPSANAINDEGYIVGRAGHGDPSLVPYTPTLWHMDKVLDLGGPGGRATDINARNEIVGINVASLVPTVSRAFFYSLTDSAMVNLPLASNFGQSSRAYAINDDAMAVGALEDDASRLQAVAWRGDDVIYLQTLPAVSSVANDINNSGEVVGSYLTADQVSRAFYWNGVMHDLNDLLHADTGWKLETAEAINSSGQIVGQGKIGGEQHAFLLTPMPDGIEKPRNNEQPRNNDFELELTSHPNPFEQSTQVSFSAPAAGPVRISLYDVTGRHVREIYDGVGGSIETRLNIDGSELASGVYFLRLVTKEQRLTTVLIRSR